ncbi:MAG: HAMP domain-containing histidine kinase [Lachnospiraceae bacterium]|nr:HAMP domain-containing histidine kinase [Lachnospiraceae bacterium]
MKTYIRILTAYIVLMLLFLGLIAAWIGRISLGGGNIAGYSDEELGVYKKIREGMDSSFLLQRQQLFRYILIFWAAVFILGLIAFLLVYLLELRPIKEMQDYALEIAKGNLDVPLPMHRGNLFGSFTESFDLMREELKRSKERELAAEHAKRELVAELSHDLKTPIATIQAGCEVLDMIYRKKLEAGGTGQPDRETESILEKIGYIRSKAETINSLVQNVFKATLEDMEEIELNVKECDSRLIEGYFSDLKDYGNIVIGDHIPECLVCIDPLRMEQVVDNIVGNSYKYAGTDIYVSFEETGRLPGADGKQNSYIRITVRDKGPGVPEEELPLIIEKFYRGSGTEEKNGYGLGLYLVKHYMEKQGGGMEYYNDHGFVVELLVRKV